MRDPTPLNVAFLNAHFQAAVLDDGDVPRDFAVGIDRDEDEGHGDALVFFQNFGGWARKRGIEPLVVARQGVFISRFFDVSYRRMSIRIRLEN
jgi:hypothetical protein